MKGTVSKKGGSDRGVHPWSGTRPSKNSSIGRPLKWSLVLKRERCFLEGKKRSRKRGGPCSREHLRGHIKGQVREKVLFTALWPRGRYPL